MKAVPKGPLCCRDNNNRLTNRRPMAVASESDDSGAEANGVARVAVGLVVFVVVVIVVTYAIFFDALAIGGDDAISDTWVGTQAGFSLLGGLVVSLVALVLAIVAKVRQERSKLLWLPLSVFPTLLVLVVLAEVLSWSS